MRVSAIVPTLDEAGRIRAALEVLERLPLHERIVVDGGSADGTVELAARPGVQIRKGARGRGPQLDAGAAAATGDVLWFVHADSLVPDDAIAQIRTSLSDPDVVAGAFRRHTRAEGSTWIRPLLPLADWRSAHTRHPYGDQALFVRRDAFFEVGGFRGLMLMEDLDLCRRLRQRGRIAIAPGPVTVSARRFQAAPFRTTATMLTFPLLYRLGAPASLLQRAYPDAR